MLRLPGLGVRVARVFNQTLESLRQSRDRLYHLAYNDPLTNVGNRRSFQEELARTLQSGTDRSSPIALMIVDLTRFKAVNDTLGNLAGDEVLKEAAARIQSSVAGLAGKARIGPWRLGGNEFAILLADSDIEEAAQRILACVRRPFDVSGQEVLLGMRVGIAPDVGACRSPSQAMRSCDLALREAKRQGGSRHVVYDRTMDGPVLLRGIGERSCVFSSSDNYAFRQPRAKRGGEAPDRGPMYLAMDDQTGLSKLDEKAWYGRMLVENVLAVDVPMISAVNGPCNIHSEVPLLGDIVLASEDAYFQDLAHFPRGMVPGDGQHVIWPMLVGRNRARYMLLTGKKLSAQEALEWGAVSEVLPKDELLGRAWELARELGHGLARETYAQCQFFPVGGGMTPLDRPWNERPWSD